MFKNIPLLFLFLSTLLQFSPTASGQDNVPGKPIVAHSNPHVLFKKSDLQQFGFDEYLHPEWSKYYDSLETEQLHNYKIAYKSVGYSVHDNVDVLLRNITDFDTDKLEFSVKGRATNLRFNQKNDSIVTLALPGMRSNYAVLAKYGGKTIGQLNVAVYRLKTEKVIVVPLMETALNQDTLAHYLNAIYAQANINFNVRINPVLELNEKDSTLLFDNPSPTSDRYSDQMREFRDAYFEAYPSADKKAYYIFIVPGFVNPKINGFMVQNKAVGFVKYGEFDQIKSSMARQLGFGVGILENSWLSKGPERGTTDNLMDDVGGTTLQHFQWENLRHSSHTYSFFDNYEDVKTNGGLVAYYFWEEDEHGNILLKNNELLLSVKRPYKKNFVSYHLNITNFFFQILFKIGDYFICLWHIIAFIVIVVGSFLLRRRFNRFLMVKTKYPRIWKFLARLGFLAAAILLYFLAFLLINKGFKQFEVKTGILHEWNGQNYKQVKSTILENKNPAHEYKLSSELLIKRKDSWYVNKQKKVLYFEKRQDEDGIWNKCKFIESRDSLILSNYDYRKKAQSHYFVFNYVHSDGVVSSQKVFNHLGKELTSKITLADPAKRILVFVNGYRPTSIGKSFEENFNDIMENGLEFPNSSNMVYDFDRYDYWRPWRAIDLLFQKRINPSETYYADGHFSVSTSNYGGLVNFSNSSSIYPKRCPNRKKHVCNTTKLSNSGMFGNRTIKTVKLLDMKSNKKGFRKRLENGKIAGKNLLLLFNELPNKSANDTLYVVAHSMGYAYSLGIIEVLRGRINFGGFYIMAPENAKSGKVIFKEWKEIWQYGSKFLVKGEDAPCLIDGVAPQSKVDGLPNKNRAYIPDQFYKKKGFFDSHFVGYYTWVFDIKKGKTGCITQR